MMQLLILNYTLVNKLLFVFDFLQPLYFFKVELIVICWRDIYSRITVL